MRNGECFTFNSEPKYSGPKMCLEDVLLSAKEIPTSFMLDANDIVREKGWIYQKGAKSEERKGTDGFTYNYAEGPMNFPDPLNSPSRTIITGEGGSGASRFKHVVVFKPTKKQKEEFGLNSKQCIEIQKQLKLKKVGAQTRSTNWND